MYQNGEFRNKKIFTQTFSKYSQNQSGDTVQLDYIHIILKKTFMKHKLNHNLKEKFNWMWQPLEKIQWVLKFHKSYKDLHCGPLSISDIDRVL